MIPRFKPSIGPAELAAAARARRGAAERFEPAFARQFGAAEAVSFQYGRGAIFALLKALSIEHAEVVLPAYTCSVAAYAIDVSGNTCRFVDREARGYNMDLDRLEEAITERTRMVMPTHLFGFPMDVDRVQAIVARAEQRWGHKIWILQDCAHAFGARWRGKRVCEAGDAALFGLGISKMMTSIFGGVVTTNDRALAGKLREWRGVNAAAPSTLDELAQRAYLGAATAAFSAPGYGIVRWLQDETSLLDHQTKAYHMDGLIRLPPDATNLLSDVEAEVGLVQLERYPAFEARRRAHARFYREHLAPPPDWQLPPDIDGATYSHFPVRVADREATLQRFLKAGIQLGQLIEYSVPHLSEYGSAPASAFPNAWDGSRHTINLPVHPGLSEGDRARIVEQVNGLAATMPAASSVTT